MRGGVKAIAAVTALAVAALAIYAMGQPLLCKCGYVKFWHAGVDDPEVSQHFLDWYTYGYLVHGILLYAFLRVLINKPVSPATAVVTGASLGAIWQIVENVPVVVRNYAQITMVQDYNGHSVVNSVGDVLATMLGSLVAGCLPIWVNVLVALGEFAVPHDRVIVFE